MRRTRTTSHPNCWTITVSRYGLFDDGDEEVEVKVPANEPELPLPDNVEPEEEGQEKFPVPDNNDDEEEDIVCPIVPVVQTL